MEPGERTAGDGDEHEREEGACEDRPSAVEGELGELGHVQRRQSYRYSDGEQGYGAYLHEGREVVAWCQKKPHRQHRGHEAVDDQAEDELVWGERPRARVGR